MSAGFTSLHPSHHRSYNQPDSFLIKARKREERSKDKGREGVIVKKGSKQGIKQERYKVKKETRIKNVYYSLFIYCLFFSLFLVKSHQHHHYLPWFSRPSLGFFSLLIIQHIF